MLESGMRTMTRGSVFAPSGSYNQQTWLQVPRLVAHNFKLPVHVQRYPKHGNTAGLPFDSAPKDLSLRLCKIMHDSSGWKIVFWKGISTQHMVIAQYLLISNWSLHPMGQRDCRASRQRHCTGRSRRTSGRRRRTAWPRAPRFRRCHCTWDVAWYHPRWKWWTRGLIKLISTH